MCGLRVLSKLEGQWLKEGCDCWGMFSGKPSSTCTGRTSRYSGKKKRALHGAAVKEMIKGWGCIKGGKGMRWAVGFGGAGRAGPGRCGGRGERDASPPASSTLLLAHRPPHGGVAGVEQTSPPSPPPNYIDKSCGLDHLTGLGLR